MIRKSLYRPLTIRHILYDKLSIVYPSSKLYSLIVLWSQINSILTINTVKNVQSIINTLKSIDSAMIIYKNLLFLSFDLICLITRFIFRLFSFYTSSHIHIAYTGSLMCKRAAAHPAKICAYFKFLIKNCFII